MEKFFGRTYETVGNVSGSGVQVYKGVMYMP